MDHKFTEQIKLWLDSPEDERDYTVGALYLLKLSGNQIMYRNIISNIDYRHDFVTHQLQKYFNFRVASLTRAQVAEMSERVEKIAKSHNLADSEPSAAKDAKHLGKRLDHDKLPDEIKAKYVENLSLLQRMRELHLRLRSLSLENATCPDSERYPFLKELISLDKKLHNNWEDYDRYVISASGYVPPSDCRCDDCDCECSQDAETCTCDDETPLAAPKAKAKAAKKKSAK